jgi:hypothetical protein
LGESGVTIFWLYLFLIFGNGFRYGRAARSPAGDVLTDQKAVNQQYDNQLGDEQQAKVRLRLTPSAESQ